jgi:hypothetical protein
MLGKTETEIHQILEETRIIGDKTNSQKQSDWWYKWG